MSADKLQALVEDANRRGDFKALQDLLRFIRKEKVRRPDLVLKYGPRLLKFRGLGDELWMLHEQVLIAALDSGDLHVAEEHLKILQRKFGGSQRVERLKGMCAEAVGAFDEASQIYAKMIETNPANSLARKRQVAVLLAQGQTPAAVKALNGYTNDFGADAEGWLQLAKLHVAHLNFEAAAFCYEELVLISPADHLLHCRLAEVYYTMGGGDNLMRARKHFSQSVDLLKANPRALMGLSQTCSALATTQNASKILGSSREREVNQALHLFAATELRRLYAAGSKQDIASLADEVLKTQGATLSTSN